MKLCFCLFLCLFNVNLFEMEMSMNYDCITVKKTKSNFYKINEQLNRKIYGPIRH